MRGAFPVHNVFRDVELRRVFVTSDPARKDDVERIAPDHATRIVRNQPGVLYTLDGMRTAGLMADVAPPECRRTSGTSGDLTLDYNGMLSFLWASVQDAHDRLDALERHVDERARRPIKKKRKRSTT